jgi:hypothetical protein
MRTPEKPRERAKKAPGRVLEKDKREGKRFMLLFPHNLDLLVNHRSGQAVDGEMDPVALFPLHREIIQGICR